MTVVSTQARAARWHAVPSLITLFCFASASYAQRDLTDIPEPDPAAELAAMQVAEGFEVNLFAADPDVANPIHMNWDADGRLWVATSRNYPQLQPGAQPTDQLIVLQDTTGDGVADMRTVFADDLFIPTGVLPGDGGVYVANSTQLIHLADTDGDGKADRRRTVLSGFGTEDTHHLLHTLRWRPDGRMAMNQSIYIHSHLETPYGVKHLDGGGIWHFDPYNSQLDIFCKGFVNPWGHAITPFGQSLVTDGAYFEGINYTFPGAVFVTSPGATRWLSGLNPGSPKHCGLEIISGAAMPADAQGLLVTNDFRGHRVCLFKVDRQGAGFRSVQLPELIRSDHVAFRPIDVKMGPDGAIYVADWYNPIIQHGEVDFRDPRRDHGHGRIWRIAAKGIAPTQKPDYSAQNTTALIELLSDSALWVRQFARQELARHTPADVVKAFSQIDASGAAPDMAASLRLQPLWLALSQHRFAKTDVQPLLADSDPRVRAAALRVVGERAAEIPESIHWLTAGITDPDDQVVLEAVCGLRRIGSLDAAKAVLRAASRPDQDQYLEFAVWNALREMESVWREPFQQGDLAVDDTRALLALADAADSPAVAQRLVTLLPDQAPADRLAMVQLIAAKGDASVLRDAAQLICGEDAKHDRQSAELLEAILTGTQSRKLVPTDVQLWLPGIIKGLAVDEQVDSALPVTLANAAGQWKVSECTETLEKWLKRSIQQDRLPLLAATAKAMVVSGNATGRRTVALLADDNSAQPAHRLLAIEALSAANSKTAVGKLLGFLENADVSRLQSRLKATVTAILNRNSGAQDMLAGLDSLAIGALGAENGRLLLATVRGSSRSSPDLENKISEVASLADAAWKPSVALTAKILDEVSQSGNAARGEQIYRRSKLKCIECHQIGPSGIAIGPNLVSLGASSPPDYVVEALLDPSAKVKEGFQTLNVLLDTDEILTGLKQSETAESLQLLLADGSVRTVATESILAVKAGKSLMPNGLVDGLSQAELVDLVAFLTSLGRVPEYTVDTKNWVRNWRTLIWSPEANRRLNRTSLDTAATDDPALKWAFRPARVDGRLPLREVSKFQPHRETPETAFLRFDLECQQAGTVQFDFGNSTDAVSFWFDSRPEPVPQPTEPFAVTAGKHRVVVGVQTAQTDGSFGCEVRSPPEGGAVVDFLPPSAEPLD